MLKIKEKAIYKISLAHKVAISNQVGDWVTILMTVK